jgi:uncharacterized protein
MPELGIPPGLVSAEPRIEVDGQDQPALATGLLSLLVEETIDGLYRCEARINNWGTRGGQPEHLYLDRQTLDFGKSIVVRLGAGTSEGEVFRGRISGLEAQYGGGMPPSIVILAEDRAQDLRKVRRTRVFEDQSDAEVMEQIAGEHGLQARIDLGGPTHKVLAQVNQSDLAFIRERARWLDGEVWLDDRTLHVQPRSRRAHGDDFTLKLDQGLLAFSVTADLAQQHSSLVVSGWDVQAKDRLSYEATDQALGSELSGDESGPSILSRAFGARVDRLVHHVPLSSTEAQALAEATFRSQARRFVSGVGTARGDARLRVGVKVTLLGLGSLFEGVYYVSEVRHLFARRVGGGYTTELGVERMGLGR